MPNVSARDRWRISSIHEASPPSFFPDEFGAAAGWSDRDVHLTVPDVSISIHWKLPAWYRSLAKGYVGKAILRASLPSWRRAH
ncbi:hypothetical protein, partial [Bradyrhizobium sp. SZCCHNS1012]|uniref:hypothetical protein n=1 Tax=Bradyrhizobium sp. SZCCHNS1012 TaxID=3057297 RepID=UPI0029166440